MNQGVIYTRGHFERANQISWEDVVKKINRDETFHKETVEVWRPNLIKLEDSTYLQGTIRLAIDEINDELPRMGLRSQNAYMFISYNVAETYGRHRDEENVLLVQSIGRMSYAFDDGSLCILDPGDSLYITSGVYHDPRTIISDPRVTISLKIIDDQKKRNHNV